jgi:hypothetical protein
VVTAIAARANAAEIDDLADTLRADVDQHGFKRQIVSVHIGNRSKAQCAYLIWVKLARNKTMVPPWNPLSDSRYAGVLARI